MNNDDCLRNAQMNNNCSFESVRLRLEKVQHDSTREFLEYRKVQNLFNAKDVKSMKRVLPLEKAPEHLQHNPYIHHGYRDYLTTRLCLESIFWWTNETINIWSHILGCLLFFVMSINDVHLLDMPVQYSDKVILSVLLICFQTSLILSAIYHIFSCKSEQSQLYYLTFDLLGVALSILAIFVTGIYYLFCCHQNLQQFYFIAIGLLFSITIAVQFIDINFYVKVIAFVVWVIFGIFPTFHWNVIMGYYYSHPVALLVVERVVVMYLINGIALFFYLSKIPERFFPGSVDFVGSSHQLWHTLIVLAFYYWYNTIILYVKHKKHWDCVEI